MLKRKLLINILFELISRWGLAMRFGVTALAAVMTVGLAGPALAADMRVKAPTRPVALSYYPTWAGFYVGATAGWAHGSADGYYQGAPAPQPPPVLPMVFYSYGLDFDAVSLGGYTGYNFQFGQWVVGFEGDLAWIGGGHDLIWDPAGSPRYDRVDLRWLAHARGRLGYALGAWLPYVSGGAAFAGVHAAHLGPLGAALNEWSLSNSRSGYSVGAGIDYQIAMNLLLRLEYIYDHFDTKQYDWVAGTRYSSFDLTVNTVRVGIAYRP